MVGLFSGIQEESRLGQKGNDDPIWDLSIRCLGGLKWRQSRRQIHTRVWRSGDHLGTGLREHMGANVWAEAQEKGETLRGKTGRRPSMFMSSSAEIKQDTLGKPKVVPCSGDRLGWVREFQNDGPLKSCTQGRLISHVKVCGLYPQGNGETLKCTQGSALLMDVLISPDFTTRWWQNPHVAL